MEGSMANKFEGSGRGLHFSVITEENSEEFHSRLSETSNIDTLPLSRI
jgi:hypothetical protein